MYVYRPIYIVLFDMSLYLCIITDDSRPKFKGHHKSWPVCHHISVDLNQVQQANISEIAHICLYVGVDACIAMCLYQCACVYPKKIPLVLA